MAWEKNLEQWVMDVRRRTPVAARLSLWDGRYFDFGEFNAPDVTLHVTGPSAFNYLLEPDLDSLSEAYIRTLIDVEGRLEDVVELAYGLAQGGVASRLARLTSYFRHSRRSDRQAIQYHYDVSNDFYAAWLDPNMVYSCAYFETGREDLATAQIKKIDHILTKIRLAPGQTLLDIGCGWGGLVLRAASRFGARCVGITLSENQYALARERVKAAGLEDRVEIRLQDYRDIDGQFDRITSVGMFEHVGLRQLAAYFGRIRDLLAEDGLALNHGITSTDAESGETPFGASDFIEKYVFPGGELPHIGLVLQTMQQGGLEALDVEGLRRHYARTLSIWSDNFERNSDWIRKEVGEEKFRIWRIYLAGCAHAFRHDWISIYQVLCTKASRPAEELHWSRGYMYASELGQA
ncbi:cyclopropane-fatty-acyl-phospholipid synthase family protein [Chitinimonas sp.]|uniref:cyclopropane-fatty-acyl-phospholipid synthase family protein n=1 Tax=Chitinimonas sp. TaxID=1934313 RepID=UPI002F95ADE9